MFFYFYFRKCKDLRKMAISGELFDKSSGERLYLNSKERRAFLEATYLEPIDIKYYCQLLYYTGCRLSEALELTPEKFDYSRLGVMIRTLKQGKDKNGNQIIRYRFNELPKNYIDDLGSYYGLFNEKKSKNQPKDKERIWQFTDRSARTYVKQIMTKADIKGKRATARGLRHSMGVVLALNKVPLNTIQKILGHKDIKNTMIYTQLVEDERRDLVSKIW